MAEWKVLIVDDEKDFVSNLSERRRLRGLRSDEAPSGCSIAHDSCRCSTGGSARYDYDWYERISCAGKYQNDYPHIEAIQKKGRITSTISLPGSTPSYPALDREERLHEIAGADDAFRISWSNRSEGDKLAQPVARYPHLDHLVR